MLQYISHTAYDISYHFTFIPKYRRRKLVGQIKEKLEGMIRFCAQVNEFEIMDLAIQPDHVHLLVSAKPTYSPSEIMQLIKGGTSKKLRELFPELEESVWSSAFWADGYFVGTVGIHNLNSVKQYIRNQNTSPETAGS